MIWNLYGLYHALKAYISMLKICIKCLMFWKLLNLYQKNLNPHLYFYIWTNFSLNQLPLTVIDVRKKRRRLGSNNIQLIWDQDSATRITSSIYKYIQKLYIPYLNPLIKPCLQTHTPIGTHKRKRENRTHFQNSYFNDNPKPLNTNQI